MVARQSKECVRILRSEKDTAILLCVLLGGEKVMFGLLTDGSEGGGKKRTSRKQIINRITFTVYGALECVLIFFCFCWQGWALGFG